MRHEQCSGRRLPTHDGRHGAALKVAFAGAFPFTRAASQAYAIDYNIKVEPGFAVPVTPPQSERFGYGGAVAIKPAIGFAGIFDLQLAVNFAGIATLGPVSDTGVVWGMGGGFRLKLPHRISELMGQTASDGSTNANVGALQLRARFASAPVCQ